MPARMARLRKSVHRGYRRMGVVDADDGASDADVQAALEHGFSESGAAALLWKCDMPHRYFSPSRRSWDEQEEFLERWNRGEELAIAYNREMGAG